MRNPKQLFNEMQYGRAIKKAIKSQSNALVEDINKNTKSGNPVSITTLVKHGSFSSTKYRKVMDNVRKQIYKSNKKSKSSIMSPYNYEIIDKHRSKESYFGRSLTKQIETLMRNGHELVGDDKDLIKIVQDHFTRMSLTNGKTLSQIISILAENLSLYNIAFIEKVRTKPTNRFIKADKNKNIVVTDIRVHSPHNVRVEQLEGRAITKITKYFPATFKNRRNLNEVELTPKDFAIARMTDTGVDFFPEPNCISMLEDILSLRSLEETVEILATQFSSPLLHATVGNDDFPGTDEEIRRLYQEINNMAPNGFIATNHRTIIKSINLQTSMVDLLGYIDHFKNRVLVGSGSSGISVGETDTTNRNTADTVNDSLSDHCNYIANAICDVFNYNIIPDILLNSGKSIDNIIDKNGNLKVMLEFNEADLDKQIAKTNHYIHLFQSNCITLEELRRLIKRSPLTDKELNSLYSNLFENSPDGLGENLNNPTNQHKKKTGPGSKDN